VVINDIQFYAGCVMASGETDPEKVFRLAYKMSKYYEKKVFPCINEKSDYINNNIVNNNVNKKVNKVVNKNVIEKGVKGGKTIKDIDDDFLNNLQKQFPAVIVREEFSSFKDWLASKGRKYKDYKAAFRNWCRKNNKDERKNENNIDVESHRIRRERASFDKQVKNYEKRSASPEQIKEILSGFSKRMVDK
tara:strand:+ start:192 stop:764 length:573 start_codon:yes stop_codon:yes gene_type:complete